MLLLGTFTSTFYLIDYPDFMTLAKDFSEKLRGFLPDDFDVSKHLY